MKDLYQRNIDYLRISVTELCNLRCRYCMPEEGVPKKNHEDMLSREELMQAVSCAAGFGVKKIRITGGEPLLKPGIVEICREIKKIPGIEELCITTNGTKLEEHARALKDVGVDRVNISLDTLDSEKFKYMTRRGSLEDTLRGWKAAEKVGLNPIKINVVLIKGFNDDEIGDFVQLTRERAIQVRFIEMMPIGEGIVQGKMGYLPASAVLSRVPELSSKEGYQGVAEVYSLPHAKGTVGLIRPITCEFCKDCNKLRITADGKIKPCLHSEEEINIKGVAPEKMKEVWTRAIEMKPQGHTLLLGAFASRAKRHMNQIGG